MRKRWKMPDPGNDNPPELSGWRREDGTINLHKFRPEDLETVEECAIAMGELDKLREHFANEVRFMRSKLAKTGQYEKPELFKSTMRLWNLAKTYRNQVQDRRGFLRKERHADAKKRQEELFVAVAKRVLDSETYLAIWAEVDAQVKKTKRS